MDIQQRKGGSKLMPITNAQRDNLESNMKEIIKDPLKTKTTTLEKKLKKGLKPAPFNPDKIVVAQYRPFIKQYLYYDTYWIDSPNQIPKFYPPPCSDKVDGGGGVCNNLPSASQTSIQAANSASSSQITQQTCRSQGTAKSSHLRQKHHKIQRVSYKTPSGPQLHEPDSSLSSKRRSLILPDKINQKFTTHIADEVPDLHIIDANQVFPQNIKGGAVKHIYNGQDGELQRADHESSTRLGTSASRAGISTDGGEVTRDMNYENITDWSLQIFQDQYNNPDITKEHIFYYIYGILHCPAYLKKYEHILKKGIPRIPLAEEFEPFYEIGSELADLHLNYETCPEYVLNKVADIPDYPHSIRFADKKSTGSKKTEKDHTKLIVDGIQVYEDLPVCKYEVNGRTPLGWLTWKPKPSKHGIDRAPFRHLTGKEFHEYACRLAFVGEESDRLIALLPKEFDSGASPLNDDKKDDIKLALGQQTLSRDGKVQTRL